MPEIYGLIITATGWRYPEVDALGLSDVWELLDYWHTCPPPHISLRRLAGMPGDTAATTEELTPHSTDEELAAFAKLFNQ